MRQIDYITREQKEEYIKKLDSTKKFIDSLPPEIARGLLTHLESRLKK
jgi:hypothetical protein